MPRTVPAPADIRHRRSRALELGLVNEVLPTDRLLPRAWEIGEAIMKAPRTATPTPSPSGRGSGASSRTSASA